MFTQTAKSGFLGISILSMLLFLGADNGVAATLHVPEEFASIQGAIDYAANGDTVLVAPGRYPENLKIHDKAVNLVSTDGSEATILDGRGLDAVVSYYNTSGVPRLEGFTVTNGSRSGISISKANPEIRKCIIVNNKGWMGGGVYAQSGACPVVISDSEITGNSVQDQGGGITAIQACIQVKNSKILNNTAGRAGGAVAGIGFCGGVSVEQSRIEGNAATYFGGGFYSSGSNRCPPGVWSTNNLVVNNLARAGGGYYQGSYGRSEITHDTISQNLADIGGGFMGITQSAYFRIVNSILYHNSSSPYFPEQTIYHLENIVAGSDIEGGVNVVVSGAATNISADPRFVDPANGDFSLQGDSPCIDRGVAMLSYANGTAEAASQPAVDLAGNLRVQGEGVDIGAYEYSVAPVAAQVKLAPGVINLNSQGQWITAIITLPAPYRADQVALGSIMLNGAIPAEQSMVEDQKLIAKFDRGLLIDYLDNFNGTVSFYARAEIPGVAVFQGFDRVRVLPRQGR